MVHIMSTRLVVLLLWVYEPSDEGACPVRDIIPRLSAENRGIRDEICG
jgi:hypothetical protein